MKVAYTKDLVIRNVAALPKGTGCRFLLCVQGQGGELVAKKWCRKEVEPQGIEVLVCF